MPKHKTNFNKKQSVRFTLMPGPQVNGKPTTYFQPVNTRKSNLSSTQKKKLIKQLVGEEYDKIQINGQDVDQRNIPSFVLQQIRGMKGLVLNQKYNQQQQEQLQYQQPDQDDWGQEQGDIEQEIIEEDDWESEEEQNQQITINKQNKFSLNEEDFPKMDEIKKIQFQGKTYQLTQKQIQLLQCVLPQNYQNITIEGVNFKKYSEEGLQLSQKPKYQQFIASQNRAVIDSYDYTPPNPINIIDNDLKPSQIKGDLKEIEQALNYQGQDGVYDQLEDDFFAKLIQGGVKQSQKQTKKQTVNKQKQQKKKQHSEPIKTLKQPISVQPQITDQMLDKALKQFDNDEQNIQKQEQADFDINLLEKMQKNLGKDGQLDWRTLTKYEKKQYMKNKKIREFYDQLRQRQIQQKMKGKKNINVEELHLKNRIKHISFEEDHVMQNALAKEQIENELSQQSEQSQSDEDDIISYRAKNSVIASNLSFVEQPKRKVMNETTKKQNKESPQIINEKPKFAPQKRNKNQTKQQRKLRKQKVKQQKTANKQYKKEFLNEFQDQKKIMTKNKQVNNTLYQISMVKII